ncbi:MAG: alpha/beta hydrolase [Mycoplasma sp.]|nr:alpha/beta hydrolase [Mycoplasma sp.]
MKKNNEKIFIFNEKGEKERVLFFHGFNSSHKFILPILKKTRNFCISSFDFPGNGYSPISEKASIQKYSEVANKILDSYKEPVTVVAHSLGGAIINFISKHKNIKKIILISPVNPYMSETVIQNKDSKKKAINLTWEKTKSLWNNDEKSTYIKYVASSAISYISGSKIRYKYMKHLIYNEMLNPFYLKTILYEAYKNNKKPTYIMQGANDPFVPTQTSKATSIEFGWQFYSLPLTGHSPLVERPKYCLEIIEDILKKDDL